MATLILISLTGCLSVDAGKCEEIARNGGVPSIVLILADDLGYGDLGCFGSEYYETPHLDRLCAEGMKLTSAYTNGPNCAPTRAALISGQYCPRTGVYTVGSGARGLDKFRRMVPVRNVTALPLDKVTLADALKEAGYRTGMFGKWHLGNDAEHHPSRRGFDEAIQSAGRHFNFRTNPKTETKPGEYLADFLTDRALEFIDRSKDRPFFLYLPHFAVHTPLRAKPELIDRFKDKPPSAGHHNPVYAAMIASVDQSVGRIMKRLDELGLAENTIVIFFSDNGGVGGYGELGGGTGRNITDNSPLRGGKGMLYEGGVRVPLIVRWPKVVKAGTTCDEPVIGIDFYPTLLEAAGAKPPQGYPLDGTSFLLPLLKSSGRAKLQRDAIYWHFPGYLQADVKRGTWRTTPGGAIRAGDFKLIEFFETGRIELYNLADDLSQKHDLASTMPDRAKELHAKLAAWRKALAAPMPKPKTGDEPAVEEKPGRKKGRKGKQR